MPTTEILMRSLAGLGLLFVGIKMVTRNLSAMAGDQFRRGIETASQGTAVAMLFGSLAGFVTQSGRTTSFILASFVQAGLIDVRRALRLGLWSNFGCTLVIFAAIFPIYLFALFLLAAAGVSIAFERPKPLLNAATATFGLALLLFGLQMMSSSAAVLTDFQWFATALAFIKTSLVFALLMGLVLTFIAQSHLAVMLIAVSLATKGVFDFDQTLMVIFGAHAGSSLITYVTGIHFRGQPRQVVTGQVLYNLVVIALFLALFLGGRLVRGDGGTIAWLTHGLSLSPGARAAVTAVIFNIAAPILLTAVLPAFHRLCARLAPPLREEGLAQPQFLREEVGENVVTTLVLAEQEQLRLLRRLPAYCASLRDEPRAKDAPSPEDYHTAFAQVGQSIERFQRALMSRQMTAEDTEWLLNQQKRQELLSGLDDACFDLWQAARSVGADIQPLRHTVVEVLDVMLLSAIDAMAKRDIDDLDLLETSTRNHGAAMERVRKKYLAVSDNLPADERNRILQITSIFERAAWSLGRFGALLRQSPSMATAKPPIQAQVGVVLGEA
jgi:phosphate:Na+ symporter